MCCEHEQEIKLLRTELKNLRNQIRGLRAQHQKDISKLKTVLANPKFEPSSDNSENSGNSENLHVKPIAFVSNCQKFKNGTPRQGVIAKYSQGILDLSVASKQFSGFENPHYALEGLEQFSHLWILFHFHQNNGADFVKTKVAPPRLKGQKVGLFSTRTPHRPNAIGLTLAKLVKIEGPKNHVKVLDLIDLNPILDIKPFIAKYDTPQELFEDEPDAVQVPDWVENEVNLSVSLTNRALNQIGSNLALKKAIESVLQEDPRSNYRREKCQDKLYYFSVENFKVTCWFDGDLAEVLKIEEQ